MTVLIQLRNAHKRYGDQVLLDGAEASIVDNIKTGFVGRNGAGKSTLLKVLLDEEELEQGEVIRHPDLRVGYLRQHDPFEPDETALGFLMRDSGQPDWKCGEVAGQFELKGEYLNGPVKSLSGGWQTRVKLAALLLHEPNLLLLDEPTNFLDLRTQILLQHFLQNFRKAAIIVSHDRGFLRETCTHTLDLSRGKLTQFTGKIDEFIEHQQERREHDQRVNQTTLQKQKQLQRFIDKNRANASTASQARSKAKQLERLELLDVEADLATAHIAAPVVKPRQGPAVRTLDLNIGYPDLTVASDVNLEIEHGDRAAIVGDNGQGKTTLLRTLVDSLKPLGGHAKWGHGCKIGVYAQHVYTSIREDQTVLEYLEYQSLPTTTHQDRMAIAGALLFREDHVKKKIKVLSGGERARLCLAGLLLGDYNILVLDEPGNHLDVETIDALCEALVDYKGTVIFTSHDRHFMNRVATSVIEVRDGKVRNYGRDYEAYLYAVNQEIEEGERERNTRGIGNPGKAKTESTNKLKGKEYAMDKREGRKLRKEMMNLERKVRDLTKEKTRLNDKLMSTTDVDEALKLHGQFERVATELEMSESRWLELHEQLES
ncbi:MAG: ABC-F family ATP-binding cassette domain-containing protein [Planctomycetota bacterium]|nr:ABC-F family ATP-binding cassette domain-containing protein [Planctomycetota bacterium]